MRLFFLFLIIIQSCTFFAQKVDLYGGINNNVFHDYKNDQGHFNSTYNSDMGFMAGVGLDSVRFDWLTMKFTLQFDNYRGELDASDGGLGGGYRTIATVNKSILSLGVFPINTRIFKKFGLSFGFVFSGLINEKFSGTFTNWQLFQPNESYNIQDKYNRYSSSAFFGLQGEVTYDIKISGVFWLSPKYMNYFGLSNEFIEFPVAVKSMRHCFCIGIKMRTK